MDLLCNISSAMSRETGCENGCVQSVPSPSCMIQNILKKHNKKWSFTPLTSFLVLWVNAVFSRAGFISLLHAIVLFTKETLAFMLDNSAGLPGILLSQWLILKNTTQQEKDKTRKKTKKHQKKAPKTPKPPKKPPTNQNLESFFVLLAH